MIKAEVKIQYLGGSIMHYSTTKINHMWSTGDYVQFPNDSGFYLVSMVVWQVNKYGEHDCVGILLKEQDMRNVLDA